MKHQKLNLEDCFEIADLVKTDSSYTDSIDSIEIEKKFNGDYTIRISCGRVG